jgi:hypothetical protein
VSSGHIPITIAGKVSHEKALRAEFPAGKDGCNARPHRPFSDREFAFPGNERLETDLDTGNVGDSIERPGRAVEGNTEVARAVPVSRRRRDFGLAARST